MINESIILHSTDSTRLLGMLSRSESNRRVYVISKQPLESLFVYQEIIKYGLEIEKTGHIYKLYRGKNLVFEIFHIRDEKLFYLEARIQLIPCLQKSEANKVTDSVIVNVSRAFKLLSLLSENSLNSVDTNSTLIEIDSLIKQSFSRMSYRDSEACDLTPFGHFLIYMDSLPKRNIARVVADLLIVCIKSLDVLQDFCDDRRIHSLKMKVSDFLRSRYKISCSNQNRLLKYYSRQWYENELADIYDSSRSFPKSLSNKLNQLFGKLSVSTIVELGCGTGRVSMSISSVVDHLIGVDSSSFMIKKFRSKVSNCGLQNVTIKEMNLLRSDIKTNSADIIVEHEAFFMLPNQDLVAREVKRILKPEGVLVRLVRVEEFERDINEAIELFDRVISDNTENGIYFVGHMSDKCLDKSLLSNGIVTQWYRFTSFGKKRIAKEVFESRRKAAFPYLSNVESAILSRAYNTSISNLDAKKGYQSKTTYFIGASYMLSDTDKKNSLAMQFDKLLENVDGSITSTF